MAKTKYVVRVVQTVVDDVAQNEGGIIDDGFIDCLRYAGLVKPHPTHLEGSTYTDRCFDLICPHGLESDVWAEQNAARMRTFGFNAVKAPST